MYSMYKITLSIVPTNLLFTHLNSIVTSPAPEYQDNLSTDLYEISYYRSTIWGQAMVWITLIWGRTIASAIQY
jgi:hypothetical protein